MLRNNRNPYDISLLHLLNKLDVFIQTNSLVNPSEIKHFKSSYRVLINQSYINLNRDIAYKDFIKSGDDITIIENSFKDNSFFLLLVYQLLSESSYTIYNVLDYHFQSTIQRSDFVNRIEFYVFRLHNQTDIFFDVSESSSRISRWISDKRKDFPYNTSSDIVKDNSDSFIQFIVDVEAVSKHLEKYFKINPKHFLEILNSPFEFKKVTFHGKKNSFIYLFKNKIIFANGTQKKTISKWLSKYFVQIDENENNSPLSFITCLGVLTKKDKAPSPKNRIQAFPV